MSVLACDRRGCENIMCDYLSDTYGYLCYECYNELLEKCDSMSIGAFMNSNRGCDSPWKADAQIAVQEEFVSRYEED